MDGNHQFLGVVQLGQFQILASHRPLGDSMRLARIAMQEAVPLESGRLDLAAYEGKIIMVRGYDGGDWVYSAEVIDQAGPILTAVVQQVFRQLSEAG